MQIKILPVNAEPEAGSQQSQPKVKKKSVGAQLNGDYQAKLALIRQKTREKNSDILRRLIDFGVAEISGKVIVISTESAT